VEKSEKSAYDPGPLAWIISIFNSDIIKDYRFSSVVVKANKNSQV
jgi:hypothetical protein